MSTDSVHMPPTNPMPVEPMDEDTSIVEVPSTPLHHAAETSTSIPASQDSLASTQQHQTVPASPLNAAAPSVRTELNDDSDVDSADRVAILSSLTPPPASVASHTASRVMAGAPVPKPNMNNINNMNNTSRHNSYVNLTSSQRSVMSTGPSILSPPDTGLRDTKSVSGSGSTAASGNVPAFKTPTPEHIAAATPDELRAMLQASLAEQTRLQTETAHYKLQYNLLLLQADDDAQRAAVEYEMTRREVEALRAAENARQARRELTSSVPPASASASDPKYAQLKRWYDELADENEALQTRVRLAKRVIQQKDDEVAALVDEKELLLNRLRENREHFHLLCSPGGLFHGAMTPGKATGLQPPATAPIGSTSPAVHARNTPHQTPTKVRATHGGARAGNNNGRDAEPMAALLQALSQENNTSAPSTPYGGGPRTPAAATTTRRFVPKHVRNAQSLSSLPTTPTHHHQHQHQHQQRLATHAEGAYSNGTNRSDLLLPSVDLVPQTEPRLGSRGGASGSGARGHGYSLSMSARGADGNGFDRAVFPATPTPARQRRRLPYHETANDIHAGARGDGHRSRESTISADEGEGEGEAASEESGPSSNHHETLARQALDSVVAAAAAASAAAAADEPAYESQASQAASAMLRRDATRESFGGRAPSVPSSVPAATTEKSAKLQAKLFGGVSKGPAAMAATAAAASGDKRKYDSAPAPHSSEDITGEDGHIAGSPKKARIVPSLREPAEGYRQAAAAAAQRVGLGIRYD